MTKTIRVHLDEDVCKSLSRYANETRKGDNVDKVAIDIIKDFLKDRGY